ncbi:NAD(P)-binding protein [Cystobasidium minutum MCA 4210]|uniref:NAD(P)-binding protein n=1 Tax=Cystobasidium minutum MCA 4210 TaxID=1397322 RepID=UPI0034CE2510|eukprot:jgi/Rhomi1/181712/fgenesh1_pg.8_\
MSSTSSPHIQGLREDEHLASPSESTSSLLGSVAPNARSASPNRVTGSLAGLNVIVTSCASLIGQAVCIELSKQGANLALTDPSKSAGQEVCRELYKNGHSGSLLFTAIELRDLDKLASYIKNASKTLKRLDCLVNCATFAPEENMMHRSKAQEVADILDHNLRTTWTATQTAIALFEIQNDNKVRCPPQGYSIVNITSSFDFNDHYSAYATAQQGILGMTRSIAMEYATNDIRVNAVSAGAVEEKDVMQSIVNQFMKSSNMSKSQIPMKRFARPKEIADVVAFLLGPGSSYITGACIPVDGGLSAKRA